MSSNYIKMGDVARDTITGYTGVVIAITKWIHGCERLTLQSRDLKDGVPVESRCFDRPQLEYVSGRTVATTGSTGGPRPAPERGR